jgi:hypothetical protein
MLKKLIIGVTPIEIYAITHVFDFVI